MAESHAAQSGMIQSIIRATGIVLLQYTSSWQWVDVLTVKTNWLSRYSSNAFLNKLSETLTMASYKAPILNY